MKLAFLLLLCMPCLGLGLGKTHISSSFSFGNSYADTGNLLALGSMNQTVGPVVSDLPPYGMTFFHHPTGRFCDGRLILDFIAQAFDLPFLPPYLAHNGSYQHGANFAVSGTTGLYFFFSPLSSLLSFLCSGAYDNHSDMLVTLPFPSTPLLSPLLKQNLSILSSSHIHLTTNSKLAYKCTTAATN